MIESASLFCFAFFWFLDNVFELKKVWCFMLGVKLWIEAFVYLWGCGEERKRRQYKCTGDSRTYLTLTLIQT